MSSPNSGLALTKEACLTGDCDRLVPAAVWGWLRVLVVVALEAKELDVSKDVAGEDFCGDFG